MSEAQTSQTDKNRKGRSFGAFLLFLMVLVGILVVVGGDRIRPRVELTQDQYEWYLHQGLVDTQHFKGENLIEGALRPGAHPRGDYFKVSFAGLEQNEARYREIKAVRQYQPVTERALLAAVEAGYYRPQVLRTLIAQREEGDKPGAEGSPNRSRHQRVHQEEQVYAKVLAASRSEWEAANQASDGPSFPLPAESSTLWLHVQDPKDMIALTSALERRGTRLEELRFDLSEGKGSLWTKTGFSLLDLLILYGPWIVIFAFILLFMRQMRSQGGAGGVMSFGRSRAQLYTKENHTNVTFDDVAGAVEAKEEVREVVEFLKNPSRFTRIGGRIPRGVLLVGPPGCGKTLLAKAIAGEADVPFFSISGSDFVEMFVGVGASRVRDLFKQARDHRTCIIFLDEIDAVGRRRGSGMGGGHDEREQTLNAILVEMDGFTTDEGIIVIAATNRPDVLDPALLRPGRFDREVVIDLPDMEGRKEILKVHLKKVKVSSEVNIDTLARSTPGYSGADLAAIINEAAIQAALAKRDQIMMDDLEEARDKVRYGRQKRSRKLEVEDKRITAYHEAGHAMVAMAIEEVDPPHKITIVPRGHALGTTMIVPEKESYHMQKKRLLGQLAVLFGGRVAEAHFCGDISAGASDDIQRATDLARAMVTELGMSQKIGPINYAERQGSDFLGTELMRGRQHSEQTARDIDEEVHRLLREAYERAEAIVSKSEREIETLAQALLRYETVSGDDVRRIRAGASVEELRRTPQGDRESRSEAASTRERGEAAREEPKGEIAGEPGLSPA
jgi:cell division protease FtsH